MTRLTTGLWIKKYPTSDEQFLIEIMLWSLAIHFPNELDSIGMNDGLSNSSQVSCPVVFKHFRNFIKLGRFYRITWDRNAPSFATDEMMAKERKARIGFTSYGITFYILSEIVSIMKFRIWWDHCVKHFGKIIDHLFVFLKRDMKIKQQWGLWPKSFSRSV